MDTVSLCCLSFCTDVAIFVEGDRDLSGSNETQAPAMEVIP